MKNMDIRLNICCVNGQCVHCCLSVESDCYLYEWHCRWKTKTCVFSVYNNFRISAGFYEQGNGDIRSFENRKRRAESFPGDRKTDTEWRVISLKWMICRDLYNGY